MFYNIIDNAIKYSLPMGIISIKLKKVNRAVQFQINNDGVGIPKEDIERIGERFSERIKLEIVQLEEQD